MQCSKGRYFSSPTASLFSPVRKARASCMWHLPRRWNAPVGSVSGMTLMGAADVAMWLAIMTKRGTEERWATSDMRDYSRMVRSPPTEQLSATVLSQGCLNWSPKNGRHEVWYFDFVEVVDENRTGLKIHG
jgi:acyl-coenzyme A thioesterase PaaI-like protein